MKSKHGGELAAFELLLLKFVGISLDLVEDFAAVSEQNNWFIGEIY